MRKIPSLLIAFVSLATLVEVAIAQDVITDEELIASAESGAPAGISKLAKVLVWEEGSMRVIREGREGWWWCMPDNPNTPAPDPLCGDANSMEWLKALMEQRDPPRGEHGSLYALQGSQIASNTDPFATAPPDGTDWITLPPNVGTVNDPQELIGRTGSATPDVTAAFIMWYGTPFAHFRMPESGR